MLYMLKWTTAEPLWEMKEGSSHVSAEQRQRLADIGEACMRDREWAFVSSFTRTRLTWVLEAASQAACDRLGERLREALGAKLKTQTCTEITLSDAFSALNSASRRELIGDKAEQAIRDRYLCATHRDICFGERILESKRPLRSLIKAARERYLSVSLAEELERIGQGFQGKTCFGHPTHYEITASREDIGEALCDSLLEALCKVGRLKSTRVTRYILSEQNDFSHTLYENLYQSAEGGAVEIVISGTIRRWMVDEILPSICTTAKRYMGKVLTVFRFSAESDRVMTMIRKKLGAFPLVRIDDSKVSGEQAVRYLRCLAREHSLRADKALLASADTSLTATELDERFEAWYVAKLHRTQYPQYVGLKTATAEEHKPARSAMQELSELVGLEEIKETVARIVRFCKARTRMAAQGIGGQRPSMHMVFTGNPGTAKTTVARLMAKALAENGVLDSECFYEVGRADLIGEYIGQTAPLVRKAFRKAKGGLLFIDEAYSLVDRFSGSYGDEAINTIVQEMENHREDTVVVFAGYPKPMEQFLDRNVGLRSRISFYVDFPDYSAGELCQIAEKMAESDGLSLSEDAKDKLRPLFESARREKSFGNGRYARKVIEQARMAQANRLFDPAREEPDAAQLRLLTAEDIVGTSLADAQSEKPLIGFCG